MNASFWNQRYGENGFAYGTAPNDFLAEVVTQLPLGPALCLAAGEGRNEVFLARHGIGPVTAVDQSAVGLAKARQLAEEAGVSLHTVVADLVDYELGTGWSVVTAIWAHLPPPLRRRVFRGVVEGLAPGGMLVLEAYTPAQVGRGTGGPPVVEMTMSLHALHDELRSLDFLVARELDRDVHEGPYHEGSSAVVQVLAQKPG